MKFRFVVAAALSISIVSAQPTWALQTFPARVRQTDPSADLLRAAAMGDVPLIRSSLKRGALLEIRDSQFLFTPLAWAAWKGQTKAVASLLTAGANTAAQSVGGAPIPDEIDYGIMGKLNIAEPSDQTPLSLAVIGNTPGTPAIVHLLLAHGANPNARTSRGNTPLLYATMRSRLSVVDALLNKGADPNIRGENDFISPLGGAVLHHSGEDPALVARLLKAGAFPVDRMFNNTSEGVARALKRTRSANLIAAARKVKLQSQIKAARRPAILYPDSNSVPTILE